MAQIMEQQNKKRKLSKIGEWLKSSSKPMMDLSGLSDREQRQMMRLILK